MLPSLRSRHSSRSVLLAVTAAVLALFLAACGGTTGEETSDAGASSGGGDKPLVYGVFATPLEEPWDGAIHAALNQAAANGDDRVQARRQPEHRRRDGARAADIATNEKPDAIIGDAFAAEEAVRKVAAEFPDIPFAFGSGREAASSRTSASSTTGCRTRRTSPGCSRAG